MKLKAIFPIGVCLLSVVGLPTVVSAQASDRSAPLPTGSNVSRPVQAGAPVVAPPVVSALTLGEVSLELASRLMKLPGVRAVVAIGETPNLLRMIAHNDSIVRLDSLLERLNAPGANRESEYIRLQTNIAAMLARTDPFKPDQLRVVIRTTSAINTFETESAAGQIPNVVVRRPFIGDMEEVVVGDTATTIAFMPASRLLDLQLTPQQAFERGRANTVKETAAITWRTVNGLLETSPSSGYDTSLLALDSAWIGISQRLGGPVAVIVPTREKIVVGRADRPRDIARLRAILTAQANGERLLSSKVWIRRGATWVER